MRIIILDISYKLLFIFSVHISQNICVITAELCCAAEQSKHVFKIQTKVVSLV
jgi:hypothetical protein